MSSPESSPTFSGRVLGVQAERALIGSACGTNWREFGPDHGLSPGQLVTWREARDGRAQLLTSVSAPEPRGDGEVARFLLRDRGSRLRARHQALRTARSFFDERGFIEVETPCVVPCPGLDAHVHSLGEVHGPSLLGALRTSPELHMKRLLVGGLDSIYQIAHCFRAEEHGTWHEPEFTMLEWYEACAGFETLLSRTEALVRAVCHALNPDGTLTRADTSQSLSVDAPFERLTVADAFREFAGETDLVDLARSSPERYFSRLTEQVEPALAQLARPVFLHKFPSSQAALARRVPGEPDFAERTELYALGIELSNGFVELTDPVEQRARFLEEQARRLQTNEPVYPLDEKFLAALEEGMPESVGNALGFDRLVALCLGAHGVAEVMAFSSAEK